MKLIGALVNAAPFCGFYRCIAVLRATRGGLEEYENPRDCPQGQRGGGWAEVPSMPGCATQGETMEEIETNIREAIEGCLSVDVEVPVLQLDDQVVELAL